jgi:hypothetical protein
MFTRILVIVVLFAIALHAADVFHHVSVSELIIHEGELNPTDAGGPESIKMDWQRRRLMSEFLYPQIRLDGEGEEAYLRIDGNWNSWQPVTEFLGRLDVVTRTEEGTPVTGVLVLPNPDLNGTHTVRFQLPDKVGSGNERQTFYEAKKAHYQRLLNLDGPGAAWFRHQIRNAEDALSGAQSTDAPDANQARRNNRRTGELNETYNLFTGGRALSENLQLDRELTLRGDSDKQVDLSTIPGVDTNAIDWTPIVKGMAPALDPTASLIPDDQHALFFPTFQDMTTLVDEAKANGVPILRLLDPRSEDAMTQQRYEKQLGVSLDFIARKLGPAMVSSLAVTGSDPYMRTGTDFAVVFECSQPEVFHALLVTAQKAAAIDSNANIDNGMLGDFAYTGVTTPDRVVSSYILRHGDFIVLTNSKAQLEKIVRAMKDEIDSIADAPEYIFFRDRYPLERDDETAFLVLTDAAIRHWCSPKWRIAASRRIRAAAVMAEIEARLIEAGGDPSTVQIPEAWRTDFRLELSERGARSRIYNTPEFLTPIIELDISTVSEAERNAYDLFRRNYQNQWRQFFDPIAISLSIADDKLEGDMTVRPLIGRSDYREFMEVVGNTRLAPDAGDPHRGVLGQFIMSLDPESEPVQEIGNFLMSMTPNIKNNSLNWIGEWFTVFVEADPFWEELAAAAEKGEDAMEEFMEHNFTKLPVGIAVDVRNPFTLTTFLAAARGFIEQTAPGMMMWTALTHSDLPYVRVSPSIHALGTMPEEMADIAIYYAAMPDMLLVTLNEGVVKSALERKAAKTKPGTDKDKTGLKVEWLGESLAWRSDATAFKMIEAMAGESMSLELQRRAWGNLIILNEWKREFGVDDPVAFHAKHWDTRLVCPGGGEYVWNEAARTMESTVFGHPATPKAPEQAETPLGQIKSAGFGLTFEGDGLRARTRISRE